MYIWITTICNTHGQNTCKIIKTINSDYVLDRLWMLCFLLYAFPPQNYPMYIYYSLIRKIKFRQN